mmetsp:Transcript_29750/g.55793  ORF Transcript_29750/g.55793 Transcript_29750/m.55793 type:complete len:292 (+) Transcript_29750:1479-2354(+)
MPECDAVCLAWEGIMRVKLPALIDQVIVICTGITNDVSILVGGIVNARRAEFVLIVDVIQLRQGVFLSIIPPIVGPAVGIIIGCILGTKVDFVLQTKVVKGHAQVIIWHQAVIVCVQSHYILSIRFRSNASVNRSAIVTVPYVETVFIGHVGQARQCNDVLILINRPKMLGDLFNELVELLTIDTQQHPFRIGFVTIKDSHGFVTKVFIVSVSLVVGVDVRSPHHPSGTSPVVRFLIVVIFVVVITTALALLMITVNESAKHSIGLLPHIVIISRIGILDHVTGLFVATAP